MRGEVACGRVAGSAGSASPVASGQAKPELILWPETSVPFLFKEGVTQRQETTLCQAILDKKLPAVIPDLTKFPEAMKLPAARLPRIEAGGRRLVLDPREALSLRFIVVVTPRG